MSRSAPLVAVLLLAGLAPPTLGDEPTLPQGLVEVAHRPMPAIEGDTLRFAVLSDTHAATERTENLEVFRTVLQAVGARAPDLVVFAGDNVDGPAPDAATLARNWQLFDELAAELPCPYRMVVGNNDVYDVATAHVWLDRYGPPERSFRVGSATFVLLSSEDLRAPARIDDRGVEMVRKAVETAKEGEHLFVFLHRPAWRVDAPLSNWMSVVHPLLARHPSAHVFAGHWHHYEQGTVRDGVHYTVCAPAGGHVGAVEVGGEFHAFLLVTVTAADVNVEVVRAGEALPADVVTEARCTRLHEMETSLEADAVAVGGDAPIEVEAGIRLRNALDDALRLSIAVTCPEGGHWTIVDASTELTAPPGERVETTWHLVLDGDALPPPGIHVRGHADGHLVLDRTMPWPLRLDRRLRAVRVEEVPTVDGDLAEVTWSAAPSAGRFVTLDGTAYAGRATDLRALWTPEHLYLALRCEEKDVPALTTSVTDRDWGALVDDAVLLFLHVRAEGPVVGLGATAAAVPTDFRIAGGRPDLGWNGPWDVAVARDENGWTVEIAVPWSTLGFEPAEGARFSLGAYRHATPGGRDLCGWTPPQGPSLANAAAFGTVVLD